MKDIILSGLSIFFHFSQLTWYLLIYFIIRTSMLCAVLSNLRKKSMCWITRLLYQKPRLYVLVLWNLKQWRYHEKVGISDTAICWFISILTHKCSICRCEKYALNSFHDLLFFFSERSSGKKNGFQSMVAEMKSFFAPQRLRSNYMLGPPPPPPVGCA